MIQWAIEQAREQGCGMIQLTTDKTRKDAHRFYERLGFEQTHLGFKMKL
jgi:GNAT superfamily N-acetyltransferase